MLDHVADLVGMGFEHDDAFAFSFEGGPGGAVGIALDVIGEFFDVFGPNFLAGHFEAGGAGGVEEGEEEIFFELGHGVQLSDVSYQLSVVSGVVFLTDCG